MSWLPESISLGVASIGASETNTVVSKAVQLTEGGSRRLRVDAFLGQITDTDNSSLIKLQTQTGYGIWNDQATVVLGGTKNGNTFTVTAATNVVADTSHGLVDGNTVVVNSGTTLPAGLSANTVYYVKRIDANSFYLCSNSGLTNIVDITDTGTGTHSWYAVTQVSIALEDTTATTGGQSYTPMEHRARVVASSGAGDSAVILDVMLTQER